MYFVDAKYLYCDIQSRASHQLMQQPRDVQVWLHNIYKLSTPYLHIIYTISPQVWLHLHGGGRPPGLGLAGECEEAEDGETADQAQHRPQAEAGRSLGIQAFTDCHSWKTPTQPVLFTAQLLGDPGMLSKYIHDFLKC